MTMKDARLAGVSKELRTMVCDFLAANGIGESPFKVVTSEVLARPSECWIAWSCQHAYARAVFSTSDAQYPLDLDYYLRNFSFEVRRRERLPFTRSADFAEFIQQFEEVSGDD